MGIWGADVQQLRALGKKLDNGGQTIDDQRTQLTSALNGTQWMGPDADKFKNEWQSQHVPALNKVAEALRTAGKSAAKNATEQETASK
ncbi:MULTISPECIES: WXG100 family type VII secretion target [Arthrobacter]|uniref:WXG100 family type VII secretion target n=3 Tax=Arthrobacter TaxID=1663 RepID=A0ABU9KNQ8_9MICC|nr:WXG100 family type VII secretion target [Arthrobacter sp. YJM1]MDP5228431.1 WXG100 family type VII secretion target [Arthrobacter sp. YJM1]MDP5228433.1 WXG100 family type VII secretion target [Arthrobacter sp. YJM1]